MSTEAQEINSNIINGIDTGQVMGLAGRINEEDGYGKFKFRASNRWVNGAENSTSIRGFFAGGEENTDRDEAMLIGSDQPIFLGGGNTAPNSVEYLLHALTSCLTVTLTYHASVQGIALGAIETSAEGDMNAKGFFGLSEDVNKGYERIRVRMRVASQASVETLTALTMHSPVFETVSKAVPVDFVLERV